MPSSDPARRFADILEHVEYAIAFSRHGDVEWLRHDTKSLYATKYALLIISEAAAKLGDLAVETCPEIPWREIRGLGNRLRHEYETVETTRIARDLPPLAAACRRAIRELP